MSPSVLRHPDPADRAAGPDDAEGLLVGGQVADALQDGVSAVAAGQLTDLLDAFGASFGDDVGGAELAAQIGAVLVPAHQNDLLGAEAFGRHDREQPDRAVADHRHRGPGVDTGPDRAVVAGTVHVGERQQRRQQRGVRRDRQLHQRAVGERNTDRPGLTAAHTGCVPEPAVTAGGLQALAAEVAGVVLPRERGHDQVTGLDGGHVLAGLFDEAEELVAHRRALLGNRHAVVRVQVAAAHAGQHDPDEGVGGLLQDRVGHVDHAYVAGTEHVGGTHQEFRFLTSLRSPPGRRRTARDLRLPRCHDGRQDKATSGSA